ncbi:MAG: F0F1 ATP synthase subunit B [Acetobacteraceae bacterium]
MEYQDFVAGFLGMGVFWVTVAVVIFALAFGKKLWNALVAMLDGRAAAVRAELDEARRLKEEAMAMLADAKTRREAALADARQLLDSARAEAARVAEAAALEAQASSARREKMVLDRIAAAEKAAIRDVQIAAVDLAARASQEVLTRGFYADHDATLIDRAIASLPAAFGGHR